MTEYVYLLSNESMPGLVKVGRTVNHPSRRMAELDSTGVPTPFELELSIGVSDSTTCERIAHHALSEFRVRERREFFKVSIEKAISLILEHVPDYILHDYRDDHRVDAIQREVARKRQKIARVAHARHAAELQQFEQREAERIRNLQIVQAQIERVESTVSHLGKKPERQNEGGLSTLLLMCYSPIPLGWITWLGTLQVLFAERQAIGIACIVLLFLGYGASEDAKKNDEAYQQQVRPYEELEVTLRNLKGRADALSKPFTRPIPPPDLKAPRDSLASHDALGRNRIQVEKDARSTQFDPGHQTRAVTTQPSRTRTSQLSCDKCATRFQVTLTQTETHAACPGCRSMVDSRAEH